MEESDRSHDQFEYAEARQKGDYLNISCIHDFTVTN